MKLHCFKFENLSTISMTKNTLHLHSHFQNHVITKFICDNNIDEFQNNILLNKK